MIIRWLTYNRAKIGALSGPYQIAGKMPKAWSKGLPVVEKRNGRRSLKRHRRSG